MNTEPGYTAPDLTLVGQERRIPVVVLERAP